MTQWQLTFKCPASHVEGYSSYLETQAISVCGCEKDEQTYEIEAIFNQRLDLTLPFELIALQFGTPVPTLKWTLLENVNWLQKTWHHFPPLKRGRFYVYGSHVKDPVPEGFIGLEINAATAFGSGEHETTQGCMQAIESLDPTQLSNALDLGCGSGILALSIAKNFSIPVTASDNDPEAVRVTQYNAELNKCENLVASVVSEGFEHIQGQYSLIVANIFAGPLCDLASAVAKHLAPHGSVILSGFYDWQASDVLKAYAQVGLPLKKTYEINHWVTVLLGS